MVGTPAVAPATIARLARALYRNDSEPITTKTERDPQGIRRYIDQRMQRVSDHLTRAELTQCAHRSRALRAARTVVTMCLGEIDYLPATETVNDLPQLTQDGRDAWQLRREQEREKLEQARELLEQSGCSIYMLSVRDLQSAARVSTEAANNYLRQARAVAQQNKSTNEAGTPTHHLCSPPLNVSDDARKILPSRFRNKILEPPPAPEAAGPPTDEREKRIEYVDGIPLYVGYSDAELRVISYQQAQSRNKSGREKRPQQLLIASD